MILRVRTLAMVRLLGWGWSRSRRSWPGAGSCRHRGSGRELLHGVQEGLGEGRERLDDVLHDGERDACADGERGLLEPLARLGAYGVGAGEAFAVGDERH